MTAMDNQAPVGLAIQQLWKLKVAGRITEEEFIDMTVTFGGFSSGYVCGQPSGERP